MESGNRWFKFYGQDWLTDLKIRRLSPEHRLCYITLLCLASASAEQGKIAHCSEEDIIELSGFREVPGLDDTGYDNAKKCLERFEELGMITRNVITGSTHYFDVVIVAFQKRQDTNLTGYERLKKYRKNKRDEMAKKREKQITRVINDNEMITIEENRIEKNRREERENTPPTPPQSFPKSKPTNAEEFERFWEIYPKKAGRESARRSWRSMQLDDVFGKISVFLERAKETDRWKRGFIPSAKNFLEERRWEDDVDSYADAKPKEINATPDTIRFEE